MKIRLMGSATECAAAIETLRLCLDVLAVSGDYTNRGDSRTVRVYLDANVTQEAHR
jgi:hypothetical protein